MQAKPRHDGDIADPARPPPDGAQASNLLREYDKVARLCAGEGVDHPRYLMRLAEMEMIDRERRMVDEVSASNDPASNLILDVMHASVCFDARADILPSRIRAPQAVLVS
jgi:hypothetical protein